MAVRLAVPADAGAINSIYRPFVTHSAVSFELQPPTDPNMAQRIANTLRQFPWLVFYSDAHILGYAYAGRYRERAAYQWSAETAIYVDAQHQRRGIGQTLYQHLFAILHKQGYYTAYAGIALPNAASLALHRIMGFEPVGIYKAAGFKQGAWRDVSWWQKPLRDYTDSPIPPTPLAELAVHLELT